MNYKHQLIFSCFLWDAALYPETVQSLNLYLLAAPGADNQKQVQDRIKKLDDENQQWMKTQLDHLELDSVVTSQMTTLGEMGTAAKQEAPFLVKALKNNDIDTRANAAPLLEVIGPDAAGAIPALAKVLKDKDPRVRADAAFALGTIDPAAKEVLPSLESLSNDKDPIVRKNAAAAIRKINPAAE